MIMRICSVTDCGRKHNARGFCDRCLKRWMRLGSVELPPVAPPLGCKVDGCDSKHKGHGFCHNHWQNWRRTGDPLGIGYPTGEANTAWRGDEITYGAAHARCRALWGKASEHPCVDCGKQKRLMDWSYCGGDPAEKTEIANGYPVKYSVWPEFYASRCRPCHSIFDHVKELV